MKFETCDTLLFKLEIDGSEFRKQVRDIAEVVRVGRKTSEDFVMNCDEFLNHLRRAEELLTGNERLRDPALSESEKSKIHSRRALFNMIGFIPELRKMVQRVTTSKKSAAISIASQSKGRKRSTHMNRRQDETEYSSFERMLAAVEIDSRLRRCSIKPIAFNGSALLHYLGYLEITPEGTGRDDPAVNRYWTWVTRGRELGIAGFETPIYDLFQWDFELDV